MEKLTAILLPGIYGTGKMFGPLLDYLPDWIAPQIMNYPSQEVLSYAELTEYVVQRVPEQGEFIIIAESYAGPLALMVCERIPARVKALVLACTFVTNPRPWLSIPVKWWLRDWMLGIKPRDWMVKALVTGFDVSDAMLARIYTIVRQVAPAVMRHRLYDVFAVDVRDKLTQCVVPMLHLYGEHDHLILNYSTREIQRLRPDIPSIGIDGPHYIYQLRPQQCSEHIEEFLQQIEFTKTSQRTSNA